MDRHRGELFPAVPDRHWLPLSSSWSAVTNQLVTKMRLRGTSVHTFCRLWFATSVGLGPAKSGRRQRLLLVARIAIEGSFAVLAL